MNRTLGLLAVTLGFLFNCSTYADTTFKQPDLISLGGGYYDFDKTDDKSDHKRSSDMRLEYRWGASLLPMVLPYFRSWENNVQLHPYAGVEVNSLGSTYTSGGFALDTYMASRVILTWSEGVGYYSAGDMKSLSGVVEFRSMGELGYRFPNEMRLTAQISHISDAHLTKSNPGAEIAGLYLHVPTTLFGSK